MVDVAAYNHYRLAALYRAMIDGQKRGSFCFTEQNLLDCARHFWYNGEVGENYSTVYVRRRK